MSGVKVIDSNDAYIYNNKTKRKDIPNPKYDFVGKVDANMPNFILKMNKTSCKTGFIEEVSCLPKRVKSDLVNHFYDKNGNRNRRQKAYLVRTDNKSKTSFEVKKSLKNKK